MTSTAPPVAHLPSDLAQKVAAAAAAWTAAGNSKRLWAGDASLWTNADESKWLGWLGIVDAQLASLPHLVDVAKAARGFEHAVVLGMGGSSLCPDVLAKTFGRTAGAPRLNVLDSTDSAQIRRLDAAIDAAKSLFFVSSKSGSTLEPNVFFDHFLDRVRTSVGAAQAGKHFVAVTDPGSQVERVAAEHGFLRVCHGIPSIGGRYSALSDFGMAPAAAMGLDVADFLRRAKTMADACRDADAARNPGVALGVALGVLANAGRDKLTIVASPRIASLGAWLEQLVAESTGKRGKALIPVDGETLGAPEVYGADRVFVEVRLAGDATHDAALARLAAAGHPVLRVDVADAADLGAEFFRWEIATAVVGHFLAINPFDQPDVEASKVATRKLTSAYEETGALPEEKPFRDEGPFSFFADAANADALSSAKNVIAAHLDRLRAGDYFGLLLYVDMNDAHVAAAQAMRQAVRDRRRVATCVGFGPRFLHSTGQAYKGGPNTGVFLQVTCDDARDLPIPGRKFTFGVVKAAQARGDFDVLAARGRRALRVHIRGDVTRGLNELGAVIGRG